MRRGAFASLIVVAIGSAIGSGIGHADPRLEASGFLGIGWFGDDTELGNSWAPEQVPGTAPLLGVRFAYVVAPRLVARDGESRLALAFEGELAMATSYTGGSAFGGGGRMSYFAPVFGWRGHATLRAGNSRQVTPHVLAGVGGASVVSSSPFMTKETDPVFYYGPGVTLPITDRWQLRVDMRHGIMAGRNNTTSSTFELQFGVGTTLDGVPPAPRRRYEVAGVTAPVRGSDERIANPLGGGPTVSPKPSQIADADRDGLADKVDQCATKAEDKDGYADDDGCPDLDDDGDLVEDARDKCPRDPETRNGVTDDDGCPDAFPEAVTTAIAGVGAIKFEANRARLTPAAQTALRPLFTALETHRELRIVITGHPERAGNEALAKRRAEAVKWFLVDEGLIEDRFDIVVGPVGKTALSIAIQPPQAKP